MQFCPQCDNVMDIGKSIPKVNLLQNTPNAVTTTSQSQVQEDIVDKLIEIPIESSISENVFINELLYA